MKPKKFRDNLWPIFVGYEIFFAISALAVLCIILFSLYWHMKEPPGYTTMETILMCGSFGSLLVAVGWMFNHNLFLPRAFGRLLVYEDRVVYKCLLRKTRVLRFEECEYIGVENFDKLNRGLPVVRGDETSFIYFSKNPFPQKYVGKVTTLKNSKDFIKITYTDKLAKALIDILPAEKDNLLRSFYAKMQAADRELNANKKRKKSKKK